jgi:hypothetical protein
MSFGNIGTLMAACGGGPQHVLTQLGDNSTAKITPVPYNDWNGFNGYLDGASKIDTAIKDANTTDKILVFAHSFGAVAVCQWLRQYGPTCTVDPSRLQFVLIGNSVRPGASGAIPNGLCAQFGEYGGPGPDISTAYRVTDAVRQWDKWADYPNVYSNAASWTAANVVNYGDSYPSNIHVNYNNINLSTPDATATFGNVTFQLFQTTTVPMSGVTRNQVEPAYNRIVGPVAF